MIEHDEYGIYTNDELETDGAGLRTFKWLVVVAMIGAAIALIGSAVTADASPARVDVIKRVAGLHEVKNRKTIQRMIGVNPSKTPWCGYAIAYAVRKAGGKPPKGYPSARAWKHFGRAIPIQNARKGDVIVLRTKRGYHVTIYNGRTSKGRFSGCGGNQSNRFQCSNYRVSSIRAVRR